MARASGVPGDRLVYQPIPARIGSVVFFLFAVWWVADLAVHHRVADALVLGAFLLAACATAYAVFWRPAVIVDDEGVELRNVLRDVRIPWSALEAMDTRFTLTLSCGDKRYQSWAAAAPGRPVVPMLPGRRRPDSLGRPGYEAHRATGVRAAVQMYGGTPFLGPDRITSQRPSRGMGTDSGAAAFMIDQKWDAFRARPGSAAAADEPPAVRVSWHPQLMALVGVALLAGIVGLALN